MKKLGIKEKLRKKLNPKDIFIDALVFTAASFIYALSVNCFTAPNNIAPGGVTGLATVINYLTGFPIGLMGLLINIPLLILATILIGGLFTAKTVIATLMMNVFIDIVGVFDFIPKYTGDKVLCCLFGGLLSGIATGLLFLRGSTGGGTDVIARLLKLKWKNVSAGRMIRIADAVVIAIAWIVYGSMESMLYAVTVIFVSTLVTDKILYGGDGGKCYMVISKQNEQIAQQIGEKLNRGVTFLDGKGYYSGQPTQVLLCTVRKNEAAQLRALVRNIDPDAFAIALEAGEIFGEGFNPIFEDK